MNEQTELNPIEQAVLTERVMNVLTFILDKHENLTFEKLEDSITTMIAKDGSVDVYIPASKPEEDVEITITPRQNDYTTPSNRRVIDLREGNNQNFEFFEGISQQKGE